MKAKPWLDSNYFDFISWTYFRRLSFLTEYVLIPHDLTLIADKSRAKVVMCSTAHGLWKTHQPLKNPGNLKKKPFPWELQNVQFLNFQVKQGFLIRYWLRLMQKNSCPEIAHFKKFTILTHSSPAHSLPLFYLMGSWKGYWANEKFKNFSRFMRIKTINTYNFLKSSHAAIKKS